MAKSPAVRRAELSRFAGELAQRAAQYVRMSTIQRYSIKNQAAAIAAYAARYNFNILRASSECGARAPRLHRDQLGSHVEEVGDLFSKRSPHIWLPVSASLSWTLMRIRLPAVHRTLLWMAATLDGLEGNRSCVRGQIHVCRS